MTVQDELPNTVIGERMLSVEEAARALGVGRTLAYELIRNGEWPTAIVRMGRLIRVPSGPLRTLLRTGALPAE